MEYQNVFAETEKKVRNKLVTMVAITWILEIGYTVDVTCLSLLICKMLGGNYGNYYK